MRGKLVAITGSYILIIVMVATVMIPILDGMDAQLMEVKQNTDALNYMMGTSEETAVDIEVTGRTTVMVNGYKPRTMAVGGECVALAIGGGFIISGHPTKVNESYEIATLVTSTNEVLRSNKVHIESGYVTVDPGGENERSIPFDGTFFYASPDGTWIEMRGYINNGTWSAPYLDKGQTAYIVQIAEYNAGDGYWGAYTYNSNANGGVPVALVPMTYIPDGTRYTDDNVRYNLEIQDYGTYERIASTIGIEVYDSTTDTWIRPTGSMSHYAPRFIVPSEYHIEETKFGPVLTLIHITPIVILMLMIVHLGYEVRREKIEDYWN